LERPGQNRQEKDSKMKNLLMALVAVGLVVGCGGDTAGTKKETKTTTTTGSTGGGTVKKEETKKEEVKETKKEGSGS